jgi:hypothetical protein
MNGWNEDNFLEEMMPLLREKSGRGRCPDAEALCAALDGRAPGKVREAVAAHATDCPECAQLCARLRGFTAGGFEAAEWPETEQRLDQWMQVFLRARAAESLQQAPAPARISWWRGFRLQWVLVPAMVILVAAGVLWLGRTPTAVPGNQMAAAGPSAPEAPVFPEEQKPSPARTELSVVKPDVVKPTEPVALPPLPQLAPPRQEPAAPPQTAPAEAPAPVTAEPQPARSSAPPGPAGQTSLTAMQAQSSSPPPRPAAPAQPLPEAVRIDAGTRVWILLKSTNQRANGGFEFRGVVLLPVTRGGAVVLDRETEVYGFGTVNQGRTSIRIVEFVWRGARYRLREAAGTAAKDLGAGPAVEFNAGQVLETWLATVSTYEKVSGVAPRG